MAQCRTKNVGNNFAGRNGNDWVCKGKYKITRIAPKDTARTAQLTLSLSSVQTLHPHPFCRKCKMSAPLNSPPAVVADPSNSWFLSQHLSATWATSGCLLSVCLSGTLRAEVTAARAVGHDSLWSHRLVSDRWHTAVTARRGDRSSMTGIGTEFSCRLRTIWPLDYVAVPRACSLTHIRCTGQECMEPYLHFAALFLET